MDSIDILNTSQSQDIFLPHPLTLIFFLLGGLIILFFIEKLFIFLFLLIIPSTFLLIIVMIVLHLYLLRLIVFTCAFPGKNPLVQFYLRHISSRAIARNIKGNLQKLTKIISSMLALCEHSELNRTNCEFIFESIDPIIKIIDENNRIFNAMSQKYPQNDVQYNKEFRENITKLNDLLNGSRIWDIISLKSEHDNLIILLDEEKEQFKQIQTQCDVIINLIDVILFEPKFDYSKIISNIKTFILNDLFRSKEYVRMRTLINLPYEEIDIKNSSNKKLDCVILKSPKRSHLMIICGPNLTCLEHLERSWDLDEIYSKRNIDILLWNYQGYGFSGGSANFGNVKQDVEIIYDYVKNMKIYDKIGIHGLSVGGIPACHLGNARPIDLIIADRTFGSVKTMISYIIFSKAIMYLSKILFIENIDNADSFMKAKCEKVLLNDPDDGTIVDKISLKTVIARNIIKKVFFENVDYITNIKRQSENILSYAFNPEQRNQFYTSFRYLITFLKKVAEKGNSFELELTKNVNNDPNNYLMQNNDKLIKLTTGTQFELPMKNAILVFEHDIKQGLHKIVSCGENLYNFISSDVKYKDHLNYFFNNLFVYGCCSQEIEDRTSYKFCSVKNVSKTLEEGKEILERLLNNKDIKEYSEYAIYENTKQFVELLTTLSFFINSHIKDINNEYISSIKGHLIPLDCGHISFYDDDEYKVFLYYLRQVFGKDIGPLNSNDS